MLVSFVVTFYEIEEEANPTLKSVLDQTDDDYEIIIIADKILEDNNDFLILKHHFWNIKNIKVVVNSSIQGASVSWNTAIDLAEGKYIKFISKNDTVRPNFVKNLKVELGRFPNEQIDFIEYNVQLTGLSDKCIDTFLEKGRVYKLNKDFEPFAKISATISNKLFRTKLLKEYEFRFRKFVRYDMLFSYKFLGQTSSYLFLDTKEPMEDVFLGKVQYSAFDLVNQWSHILNYYRRIGRFKELKDYLNYGYYKNLIHIWLWNVKKYDNKLLIKKAGNFASRKFEDKREDFMKTNLAFIETNDLKFKKIVENFPSYMKELFKLAK